MKTMYAGVASFLTASVLLGLPAGADVHVHEWTFQVTYTDNPSLTTGQHLILRSYIPQNASDLADNDPTLGRWPGSVALYLPSGVLLDPNSFIDVYNDADVAGPLWDGIYVEGNFYSSAAAIQGDCLSNDLTLYADDSFKTTNLPTIPNDCDRDTSFNYYDHDYLAYGPLIDVQYLPEPRGSIVLGALVIAAISVRRHLRRLSPR